MGIQNFPAVLQPIIQQGFLEREFEEAVVSKLAYRQIADRISIPVGVGESVTKTRAGLLPTVTTPLAANTNTNLDNGLTPAGWGVEQYTVQIANYAATQDLNTVTNRVGIKDQFMRNAYTNGEQAARSLDELARNALFNSYMGGNTRVRVTLGSPGPTISVDDIRGFQYAFYVAGFTSAAAAIAAGQTPIQAPVSAANPLLVTVNLNTYTLVSASADLVNVSTSPNGVSGTLTFATNVTVADGTAANGVQSSTGSVILRPNGRSNTSTLVGTDTLQMANVLDAVATLRANAVPEVDGLYNCYLDPKSARQLFSDQDFQRLYIGATGRNGVFRRGMIEDQFLGVRFMTTTEAYVQAHPTISGLYIRRPIVCGQGALIEGAYAGMAATDVAPKDSIISVVDGIVMVTREPLDRLQQIIAQSWYWMGGYCTPSDITTSPTTVPTASNATFKRGVIIEHVG